MKNNSMIKSEMKKKGVQRKITRSSKKASYYKITGFSIIILGCLLLFLDIFTTYRFVSESQVLGASTFLAKGGDESDGSGPGDLDRPNGGSGSTNTSGGTPDNCTGVDGKVFMTSASNCENLHHQQHHTVPMRLINPSTQQSTSLKQHEKIVALTPAVSQQPNRESSEKNDEKSAPDPALEGETTDNSTMVNLGEIGTKVEIKNDKGKLLIKAKKSDGTEVKLKDNTINDLNKTLDGENGPQIQQNADGTVIIEKNGTKADTNLPVSFDVTAHQLTITTQNGIKQVGVLPDQVVNSLITNGTITGIEQTNTGSQITLTEANKAPVFQVQGVSKQKLLGIFPETIHKIVNVSAQDGTITSIKEQFGQKLIDFLSF